MISTKTFKYGRSQAIRLPKEYRFPEEELYMNKIGDTVIIVPKSKLWSVFKSSLNKFTADFMETRGMNIPDKREKFH